jgi:hypothetical protein
MTSSSFELDSSCCKLKLAWWSSYSIMVIKFAGSILCAFLVQTFVIWLHSYVCNSLGFPVTNSPCNLRNREFGCTVDTQQPRSSAIATFECNLHSWRGAILYLPLSLNSSYKPLALPNTKGLSTQIRYLRLCHNDRETSHDSLKKSFNNLHMAFLNLLKISVEARSLNTPPEQPPLFMQGDTEHHDVYWEIVFSPLN